MRACLLLLVTLLVVPAALAQRPEGERVVERRYAVEPGGTFFVRVSDADLIVETGAVEAATVEVYLDGRDMERARAYFDAFNFDVRREGETISVTTDPPREGFQWSGWRDRPQITVHATLPVRFETDLRTADGDITLGDLDGRAQIRTSDGDIRSRSITGPELSLRTSDGDLRLERIRTDVFTAQTSDGDIVLDDVEASRSSIRTSDGDIRIARLRGAAEVQTSDGDIRVGQAEGEVVEFRTSDGDITLGALTGRTATMRSSDGDLRIDRLDASLRATTSSGGIEVNLLKPTEVFLRSSDGDIAITAPRAFDLDLDLRAERVRIASGYRFSGELHDDRASGRLGAGGPLLEAASDGTVTLRDR